MKLSIITINYNNATGLRKTLESVGLQTCQDFEHVIVDGGSTDGSRDLIAQYAEAAKYPVKWVSEPDTGIYNAMNKGIRMATSEYIEILNSADWLYDDEVVEKMLRALEEKHNPDIMYGNMIKVYPNGNRVDTCGSNQYTPKSFLYFYKGTLNHNCAYIRRSLFEKYGLYDEQMKICSDWKWYVDAIALGDVVPVYVNINVTYFDMNGVSESGGKNAELIQKERREYLERVLPKTILNDYDQFAFPVLQYQRLKKYHLWGLVYFMERVLFKLEKWGILR
jgi:glycosyltransferase involved in cell wall biosynthesis